MTAFLVDECCPRAVVQALIEAGFDVRYVADTHRRADDDALVDLAQAENRIILTEDFDFGELLIRQRLSAPGAVILFMPSSRPEERAERLLATLKSHTDLVGRLTIVTARQVRQRPLD